MTIKITIFSPTKHSSVLDPSNSITNNVILLYLNLEINEKKFIKNEKKK